LQTSSLSLDHVKYRVPFLPITMKAVDDDGQCQRNDYEWYDDCSDPDVTVSGVQAAARRCSHVSRLTLTSWRHVGTSTDDSVKHTNYTGAGQRGRGTNSSLSQILSSIVTLIPSGLTSRILTCTEPVLN